MRYEDEKLKFVLNIALGGWKIEIFWKMRKEDEKLKFFLNRALGG